MILTSQIFSYLLPVIYLLVIYFNFNVFIERNKHLESKLNFVILFLVFLHTAQLILRGLAIETLPLVTKFDALALMACANIILVLFIESSSENKSTMFFAVILSFIIQTISSIFYNWNVIPHALLTNSIYAVHVLFSIFGYTAITISALYAILYILLNHNIKNHRLGVIYEIMPPLKHLELMSIRSVKIGIITLGLGIIIGHLVAGDVIGSYWPIDAKVIFNNIIWFCYFIGFVFAQLKNWRGRWMAYLSIVGFIFFILANISLLFIQNTFHQFQLLLLFYENTGKTSK